MASSSRASRLAEMSPGADADARADLGATDADSRAAGTPPTPAHSTTYTWTDRYM